MTTTDSNKRRRRMAREPKATSDAQANPDVGQSPESAATPAVQKAPSKCEKVLSLLRRTGGATLDELVAETGWLPHTTRAALTGLKKKGHAIERSKVNDVSRYIIVEAVAR